MPWSRPFFRDITQFPKDPYENLTIDQKPVRIAFLINELKYSCAYLNHMEAVDSLVAIGKDAVPALCDALRSDNATVRHWAAYSLGEIARSSAT